MSHNDDFNSNKNLIRRKNPSTNFIPEQQDYQNKINKEKNNFYASMFPQNSLLVNNFSNNNIPHLLNHGNLNYVKTINSSIENNNNRQPYCLNDRIPESINKIFDNQNKKGNNSSVSDKFPKELIDGLSKKNNTAENYNFDSIIESNSVKNQLSTTEIHLKNDSEKVKRRNSLYLRKSTYDNVKNSITDNLRKNEESDKNKPIKDDSIRNSSLCQKMNSAHKNISYINENKEKYNGENNISRNSIQKIGNSNENKNGSSFGYNNPKNSLYFQSVKEINKYDKKKSKKDDSSINMNSPNDNIDNIDYLLGFTEMNKFDEKILHLKKNKNLISYENNIDIFNVNTSDSIMIDNSQKKNQLKNNFNKENFNSIVNPKNSSKEIIDQVLKNPTNREEIKNSKIFCTKEISKSFSDNINDFLKIEPENINSIKLERMYKDYRENYSKEINLINENICRLPYNNEDIQYNKIGPMSYLEKYIEYKFSDFLKEKKPILDIELLEKNIFRWRNICGDGNCFYRAVMFSFIENILIKDNREIFLNFIYDLRSLQYDKSKNEIFLKNSINLDLLIKSLICLVDCDFQYSKLKKYEKFIKLINNFRSVDLGLVLFLRIKIHEFIQSNSNKIFSREFNVKMGSLLSEKYEGDDENFKWNEFYDENLLKLYSEAENIIIYVTPFILKINLNIFTFEIGNNNSDKIRFFSCQLPNKHTACLFYRKDHYDLIYPRDYYIDNIDSFEKHYEENGTIVNIQDQKALVKKYYIKKKEEEDKEKGNNKMEIEDLSEKNFKKDEKNNRKNQVYNANDNKEFNLFKDSIIEDYNINSYKDFSENSNSKIFPENKKKEFDIYDNNPSSLYNSLNNENSEMKNDFYIIERKKKNQEKVVKIFKGEKEEDCKNKLNQLKNFNENHFQNISDLKDIVLISDIEYQKKSKDFFSTKDPSLICKICDRDKDENISKFLNENICKNCFVNELKSEILANMAFKLKDWFRRFILLGILRPFESILKFTYYRGISIKNTNFEISKLKNEFDIDISDLINEIKLENCLFCLIGLDKKVCEHKNLVKLPCGCSFGKEEHFKIFIEKLILFNLSNKIQFTCFCDIPYSIDEVIKVFQILKELKLEVPFEKLKIFLIENIFSNTCFNCSEAPLKYKNIYIFTDTEKQEFLKIEKFNHFLCNRCQSKKCTIFKDKQEIVDCNFCNTYHKLVQNYKWSNTHINN